MCGFISLFVHPHLHLHVLLLLLLLLLLALCETLKYKEERDHAVDGLKLGGVLLVCLCDSSGW